MPTEEDQSPLQLAMASWTTMIVILIALALTAANADEWGGPEKGTALATWSGAADGAGSEAGECGYFQAVKESPWLSMVTAVPPQMFRGGAGCGTCWDLRSDGWSFRDDNYTRVVVTDVCRGGPCAEHAVHFELSGHAFGKVAGDVSKRQHVVSYVRVDCDYRMLSSYRVDSTATTSNFLLTPLYIPGYETIRVGLGSVGTHYDQALEMQRTRGAVFKTDATSLVLPYQVRLLYNSTTKAPGYMETLDLIEGRIPPGWEPGQTYSSPPFPPTTSA